MKTRFLQDSLWPELTRLAQRSAHRKVAVAFLGTGGSRLFRFRKGDVLYVNMGKSSLRSHSTNPREVEKIWKKGVEVFSSSYLHAKVYLLDNHLVVCSANISSHSRDALLEAGLATTEASALISAKGFFEFLKKHSRKVNRPFLNLSKRIYDSSHPPPGYDRIPDGTDEDSEKWWLISTDEFDPKGEEKKYIEEQERRQSKRGYRIDTIRCPASDRLAHKMKIQDTIVEIFTNNRRRTVVYRPRALLWKQRRSMGVFRRTYLFLEEPKEPKSLKRFKGFMASQGVTRIGKDSNREIHGSDIQQTLQGFWQVRWRIK